MDLSLTMQTLTGSHLLNVELKHFECFEEVLNTQLLHFHSCVAFYFAVYFRRSFFQKY